MHLTFRQLELLTSSEVICHFYSWRTTVEKKKHSKYSEFASFLFSLRRHNFLLNFNIFESDNCFTSLVWILFVPNDSVSNTSISRWFTALQNSINIITRLYRLQFLVCEFPYISFQISQCDSRRKLVTSSFMYYCKSMTRCYFSIFFFRIFLYFCE